MRRGTLSEDGPLRVALIEDNEADVFLIEKSLRELGIAFELACYSNGDEAVHALCGGSKHMPELVLLDLHLPGAGGVQVLHALRKERRLRDVPIVIISGTPGQHLEGLDLSGADRVVLKSMNLEDYLQSVGNAVRELAERIEDEAQEAPGEPRG